MMEASIASATVMSDAELTTLATRALHRQGVAEADAREAAHILVLGDLFGVSTHGVDRIPSYAQRLRIGGINPTPIITVERCAPALLKIDGDNGLGPLVGYRALRAAIDVANETGLAMVSVRGSNHFGAIMPYAYLAASEGLASIIASNATTTIAPSGGSEARLGNNPMGMGFPNPDGDPIILDMALSVVARAKIRRAADRNEPIPQGWATDRSGRSTTDARSALDGFLLPIGGYKGYGLAAMIDLFAGLMSGAAYLTHVSSWVDAPGAPQNLGHFFLIIDTKKLGKAGWLGPLVNDFADILHSTPAIDPDRPVAIPGENEMQGFRKRSRDGIRLTTALHAELLALAGESI